jgi:putative endonuclease
MNTKAVGDAGEARAAAFLERQGYEIVARNWRARSGVGLNKQTGELDIVARKNGTVVFAEVKTLPSGTVETLAQLLGPKKQKRVVKTAKSFLHLYRQYSNDHVRFDVLILDMPGLAAIHHIENAFGENS